MYSSKLTVLKAVVVNAGPRFVTACIPLATVLATWVPKKTIQPVISAVRHVRCAIAVVMIPIMYKMTLGCRSHIYLAETFLLFGV